MKSLVVLSALATIAIAAPSLLGEHFEDITRTQETLPESFKREMKSLPEETHHTSIHESGSIVGVPSIHSPGLGSLLASSRNFGLKQKPIIVKKKNGYHVYRDSDEERADSRESCPKQVKVKLCNAEIKPNDLSRSSTNDMTDGDMKHSIKMAKEAVENLQRDLKHMENNPAIKNAPWKQGDPESDAEIHEDIEVARQALEHIHRNFGDLESMSLHATTSKDADSVQDFHVMIAETDEERMAQWKQAFENIQKNVEIARNIEDSFKTANHEIPHESPSSHNDSLDESESHKLIGKEKQLRTSDNHDMNDKSLEHNLETKEHTLKHGTVIKKEAEHKDEIDDMKTSPTTLIETKIRPESNEKFMRNHEIERDQHLKSISRNPSESSINAMEKKNENHDSENSKTLDLESPVLESMSMKIVEENAHKTDLEEKMVTSQNLLKLKESEAITEHEKNNANKWSENNLKQEKSTTASSEDSNHLANLLNRAHTELKFDRKTEINKPELRLNIKEHKPADIKSPLVPHVNWNINPEMKEKEAIPTSENVHHEKNIHIESPEHSESNHLRLMSAKNGNLVMSKSADQTAQHTHLIEHSPAHHEMNMAMKSADNMHSQFGGPLMRWNQDRNFHSDKLAAMKAAEEFKNEFMRDGSVNIHFIDQQHRLLPTEQHFDMSNGMQPIHMRNHQRLHDSTMHGKSPIMDSAMQPSKHMNMRDAVATFDQDNRFQQRKPMQETSRSAYASGNTYGAVGVFPNANIGKCGIPLLLSCNPSVVSGSLSSGHQGYGGSAYRTEDDFNFHNKRDTTKLTETPEVKLKETTLPLTKTAAGAMKQ